MLRFSTALRNAVASGMSWQEVLAGSRLMLFSGSQPSSADDIYNGTKLCVFTEDSGSYTAETKASATVQVASGDSGTIDSVTVGGFPLIDPTATVAWNTDVSTTASDLCDAINDYENGLGYAATVDGDTVTISAGKGMGTKSNGIALAVTTTTIVVTADSTFTGGVDAVNGMSFGEAVAGVMTKASGTWSGDPVAGGTAGWFRIVCSGDDDLSADDDEEYMRIDGGIATSGSDINLSSTTITSGVTQTINSFTWTVPSYKATS
jgi:hypothetical protein